MLQTVQPTTAILTMLLATGCAMQGLSRNEGDFRGTIIGAYLARNAGTGVYRPTPTNDDLHRGSLGGETLQRLLELAHAGRSGTPDVIVNEAVAAQSGYICPDYDRLPLRMKGCREAEISVHPWKDVIEVRQAAERIGFSCAKPIKDSLSCVYRARITQHIVNFSILPSVDGERAGPDTVSEVVGEMRFSTKTGPILIVTEKKI